MLVLGGVEVCSTKHQVFAVVWVCEGCLANERDVFWALVDLERARDAINRRGVADAESVWSLRKVVEGGEEVLCRWWGVCPGGSGCGKELELLGVIGGGFQMNQLLFADDKALVADSEGSLCGHVGE